MMSIHVNIGLKLFSSNVNLINEATKLFHENLFQYIELYILPGTLQETLNKWKDVPIPFVVHAPHSDHGMNLSLRKFESGNLKLLRESQQFADVLQADIIIFHGGHSGTITETLRQVTNLKDSRFCMENKPPLGLSNQRCVGWHPDEFYQVVKCEDIGGIVLDFGHASCTAVSLQHDSYRVVQDFLKYKPRVFHLSDGLGDSEQDSHLNLGLGNLDIDSFLSVLPTGAMLTLETPRSNLEVLDEFVLDAQYVLRFFN
ncbi:MAG: sugar phosphate isomerase/epimerase [Desulfotalea sp.]